MTTPLETYLYGPSGLVKAGRGTLLPTSLPVAQITSISPNPALVGETVTLNGSGSLNADTYEWDDAAGSLGQYPLGTGPVTTFTFGATGTKQVRLTCTNAYGSHSVVSPLQVNAAPSSTALTWAPPDTTGWSTINVPSADGNWSPWLNDSTNYIIKMPSTPKRGRIFIRGGRNIVLIGGEIIVDNIEFLSTSSGKRTEDSRQGGLEIVNSPGNTQQRIVHVEGLWIHGYGLSDGIRVNSANEGGKYIDLRIQNCRIESGMWYRDYDPNNPDSPSPDYSGVHPDTLQPFGGIRYMRVDGLTGLFTGQALMIKPDSNRPNLGYMQFKRANFRENVKPAGTLEYNDPNAFYKNPGRTPRYLWWTNGDEGGVRLEKGTVWMDHPNHSFASNADLIFWPKTQPGQGTDAAGRYVNPNNAQGWTGSGLGFIYEGNPPGGDYVPQGMAGVNYVSPGYI